MLFDQIARNKRKTWLLLLVFFLLLGLVGYGVGYLWLGSGFGGLILALVIGFIYAVTMIFQSTNVVMAMNGAREVDEQTAPNLYHVVEDMAMVAQIPMPRVFIVNDPSMNAFATGSSPKNAAVAATTGLLAVMNLSLIHILEKGLEQGLERGRYEGQLEMIRKMLSKGLSLEVVSDVTGLSLEELEALLS